MKLAEAMNTYNPALLEIKRRGYEISLELTEDGLTISTWKAMRNNIEVFGFNPLSLLGLIVIADQYGENWRQVDTGNLYDEILEQ
ncbi:hypothetical protein [Bacteroides sp. 519]|uniref:hypothetical protein n=1 Tax=Bacteroides sp. 519 TaxID=2302937 RepID=UPI0013CF81D4|nr:hypothetical protein [Bacteroides sp. 519]NDV60550.1 hypothetical protein [Bacteroides sp. 519]